MPFFPCTGHAASTRVQTCIRGIHGIGVSTCGQCGCCFVLSGVVPLVFHGTCSYASLPAHHCICYVFFGQVSLARVGSHTNKRKHAVCCRPQPRRKFLGAVRGQPSAQLPLAFNPRTSCPCASASASALAQGVDCGCGGCHTIVCTHYLDGQKPHLLCARARLASILLQAHMHGTSAGVLCWPRSLWLRLYALVCG